MGQAARNRRSDRRYLLSPEASKKTMADLIDRYTEHPAPMAS